MRTTLDWPESGTEGAIPVAVIVGPPGVGKSTIGPLLAERLEVPWRDTDEIVAAQTGLSVEQIFAERGETDFRDLEAAALATELRNFAGVLTLGGGAVMDPRNQAALREYAAAGGTVVLLDMNSSVAKGRIRGGRRPLLVSGDPLLAWELLVTARRPVYESVCTMRIDTSALTPTQVVDQIVALMQRFCVGGAAPLAQNGPTSSFCTSEAKMQNPGYPTLSVPKMQNPKVTRVTVPVAEPYDGVIGSGVINLLPTMLKPDVEKVFVIYPKPLVGLMEQAKVELHRAGKTVIAHEVPDAEAQKTAEVLVHCWELAALSGITRSDAIVAVGGGATTDLGGFVAATWLRGIQLVQVPTSLLAMVDAAVGGKTGINTPQGKNLVGSFYQPNGVICDLDMLDTLPTRDFSAGLAEVVKCGFIADPVILDVVKKHAHDLVPWRGAQNDAATKQIVAELVARAVRVKADIAGDDVFEKGNREFLNYGHTLGHAIELAEDFQWRHGEAVAVGMVFAAELANLAGMLPDEIVTLHRELLSDLLLPTSYKNATLSELLPAMHRDKKARGAKLRFIVLTGIGQPTRLKDPPQSLIEKAFARVSS